MSGLKSVSKITLLLLLLFTSIKAQNFWQQTAGPEGAAIANIATAPNGTIYSTSGSWFFGDSEGIGNGGIYKSTNGGASWQYCGFVDRAISAIAVSSTNEVYVSMLDNEQEFNAQSNYGVYYSNNNGDSWTNLGLNNYYVTSLLVLSNGNLLAGTSYRKIFQYSGGTWVEKFSLDNDGVKKMCADNSGNIFALYGAGIYKSTNSGATWNKISTLTSTVNDMFVSASGRIFIQDYTLRSGVGYNAILYSDNGGTSWTDTGITVSGSIYFTFAQSKTGTLFSLDPGSGNYRGLKRSTDNGITWQAISINSPNAAFRGFTQNAANEIFIGGYSGHGIFKSTDDGVTWSRITSGMKNTFVASLKFDSGGNLFAGTSNGLHYSSNNGTTWQYIWNGAWTEGDIVQDIAFLGTNVILAATKSNYIQKSTNAGASWGVAGSGLTNSDVRAIHKISETVLLAGTNGEGVYRTTNGGLTWTRTSGYWYTMAIASEPAGNILASAGASIYRSTDQGATWNSTPLSYGGTSTIRKIAVNSSGHIFAATDVGLYRSTDQGANWSRVGSWKIFTGGSSNAAVYSVIINSIGKVYAGVGAGDERGVYVSYNNGDTWTKITSGLTGNSVRALALNNSHELFAGTYYNGVFKSTLSTLGLGGSENNIPFQFSLEQNYPNPFNPTTVIEYRVPNAETPYMASLRVTLKIYDALGREIKTLVDEVKSPGNYKVQFHSSNLAAGVYFYRLYADNTTITKKMLLLK